MRVPSRSIASLILVLAATVCQGGEPLAQPYPVWVNPNGAEVYSGPGDDYYATQQLPPGTECEVYQQLPDGWLAIRPPEGSHSMVLRSALGDIAGGVATVRRDRTPARVGSVLSDKFSSVHVRLDEGEVVMVLDDPTQTDSQWVTIAPPAGEFRWIREEDVTTHRGVVSQVDRDSDWRGIEKQPADEAAEEPSAVEAIRIVADADDGSDETIRVVAHDEPTDGKASSDTPTRDRTLAGQVDALEIQLSRRVAGPVNLWTFDDLEREAAQLLSQAKTPAEQQTIHALAERMGRFAAIGKRHRQVRARADPTAGSIATADAPLARDAALAGFDAVGVLRPVVAKNGNAPPYALVDESGKIVTFITPSPTLNLQQHLGQRVGVSGTRGFLPEYRSRNIQTARVAPVEATLRR